MSKTYALALTPAAQTDLLEQVQAYNLEKTGLGTEFFAEFQQVGKLLSTHPKLFPVLYRRKVRRAILGRFPYQVLYLVRPMDRIVVIFAVGHQAQHPKHWKERL